MENNFRTIKEKISEKKLRQDKNGKDYLLLKLNNGEVIFVFSTKDLSPIRWSELKEGEGYTFTVKEGVNGSNILVDFATEAE